MITKRVIGIPELCISFCSHPNISDGNFILVPSLIAPKYYRKICRGQNEHISIFLFNFTPKYKKKREELNSVKYFTQETGAQIFAKHILQL